RGISPLFSDLTGLILRQHRPLFRVCWSGFVPLLRFLLSSSALHGPHAMVPCALYRHTSPVYTARQALLGPFYSRRRDTYGHVAGASPASPGSEPSCAATPGPGSGPDGGGVPPHGSRPTLGGRGGPAQAWGYLAPARGGSAPL